MWMKETYKGLLSGIVYAKKGDEVKIIRQDEQMSFIECNNQKFHVRNERLSNTPVEKDNDPEEVQPSLNHSPKRKPSPKYYSQSQLF